MTVTQTQPSKALNGMSLSGQVMPEKNISKPPVDPLEHDWDNLYVRASNLLNDRGVDTLYIDGSVDNPSGNNIDIQIYRGFKGEISIVERQGEDNDCIYSSHNSMSDFVFPSPNFNHNIGQDRIDRLNAILDGEVNLDAPSDWNLYRDQGRYGVYKPQETSLNLSFNEDFGLGYTSLSMQHNGLKTEVLIGANGSEGTTFPHFREDGYVVEDLVKDPRFNELVQASFQAGDFEYEHYPQFNTLAKGGDWNDWVDAHLKTLGNDYANLDLPRNVIKHLGEGYQQSYEKIVGNFAQNQMGSILQETMPTLYDYAIAFMGLGAAIHNEAQKVLPAKGDRREVVVIQTQDQIIIQQKPEKGSRKAFDTLYTSHPSKGYDSVDHELTEVQKADLVLAMQGGHDRGLSLDELLDRDLNEPEISVDELQQALPEAGMNAVISEHALDTVEEAYIDHLIAMAEYGVEMPPEEYARWQEELAKASGVGNYGPDALAVINENMST
ncbi:MAG: hypothetical protein HC768_23340, partial [Acaryochloris sp. CRU_2_0]|nr:hypothetical protein [Acaryochloris sp. CRU_2_0]